MDKLTQLKCADCQKAVPVWYTDCGAPFYQWFMCEECANEYAKRIKDGE